MNPRLTRSILFLSALLVLALSACGGPATTAAPAPTEAPLPTAAPAATEAPAAEPGGEIAIVGQASAADRLVIKNAQLDLLVADSDLAIDQITQVPADYGGYLLSSQTWYDHEAKRASLTFTVPAADFEIALQRLRAIGQRVLSETASGQDVTAEYVDLESRLRNLEATQLRVRAFLDNAKTVEESLAVNQELARLEGEIEQVRGQMNYYRGRAAFSTISVNVIPEQVAPPRPKPSLWNLGETFSSALDTLSLIGSFAVRTLIWLAVVGSPFALAGLAVFGLVKWLRRVL